MAFEFLAAYIKASFHVAKTGFEPDVLNEGYQRKLVLRTHRLDEIVCPKQHTSRRRIGNDVGYPENAHSVYPYRRYDQPNDANRSLTLDRPAISSKCDQLSQLPTRRNCCWWVSIVLLPGSEAPEDASLTRSSHSER